MKPHITKCKRGWKCRLGWKQVVEATPQQAYERFAKLERTFWRHQGKPHGRISGQS